jgi:hypothetical protein
MQEMKCICHTSSFTSMALSHGLFSPMWYTKTRKSLTAVTTNQYNFQLNATLWGSNEQFTILKNKIHGDERTGAIWHPFVLRSPWQHV